MLGAHSLAFSVLILAAGAPAAPAAVVDGPRPTAEQIRRWQDASRWPEGAPNAFPLSTAFRQAQNRKFRAPIDCRNSA